MAKKPANLLYGVDEKPPLGTAVLLGMQHMFVISVGWVFVLSSLRDLAAPPGRGGTGDSDFEDRIRHRHDIAGPGRKGRLDQVICAR